MSRPPTSTRARSTGCGSTTRASPRSASSSRSSRCCRRSSARTRAGSSTTACAVSLRRIPIGAVGANFEARPNVAVDVAGQLLKSLNAAVLRTGGAALRTVTVLVDEVLRPALADAGLPPAAVGLVRSPEREGARVLVSLPQRAAARDPARQRRDDRGARARGGAARRPHARARRGRRRPLRRRRPPTRRWRSALVEASLDRLGVCNRLNLLLVDRAAEAQLPRCSRCSSGSGIDGARAGADRPRVGERRRAHRVASRCASSTRSTRRSRSRTTRRRVSPRRSSTEDEAAAERFLAVYRGTAAFWNAPTRFTDGFALTGAPETGINVDRVPGPARAGDVPRSLAAAVPRRRRRNAAAVKRAARRQARLEPRRRRAGPAAPVVAARARRGDRGDRRVRHAGLRRLLRARSRSACAASGSTRRPTSLPQLQAASALGQVLLQRAWQDALRPHGLEAAQILLTGTEIAERRAYVNARSALTALFSLGAVPVVNENDATATDEISFGDNDALAAQVAVLVRARLLVLLTSVPGRAQRGRADRGRRRRRARRCSGPGSALGRGGMESKVSAAEVAAGAGIQTVIAGGDGRRRPLAASSPAGRRDALRRRRVGAGVQALAAARQARDRPDQRRRRRAAMRSSSGGGSLLAVGVSGWDADFRAGDGVELVGPDGAPFARGIASVERVRARRQAGQRRGRAPRPASCRRSTRLDRTTHFPKYSDVT